MSLRPWTRALLGASVLAAGTFAAAPASAQRVDNIVSFGDSYADIGNAVALILASPNVPEATKQQVRTLYGTGRFSGGTNYIDTLATLVNATIENYAIGGALTGTGNVNAGLPGFTQQTGIFLSGTVPPGTPFPTSNRSFEAGDLLAVSVGGNDARAFQQANPTATTAQASAAANVSVASATANLNALVAAGAPTISFLAGNTSQLPEVALLPDPTRAAAIRNAFSTTFNTGIQSTLAGYAANGTVVHYLDLSAVLGQVAADPAAYGVPNGVACAPTPANVASGCDGYLFYVDQLHLSSDGFAIVGQYVAAQLQAPLTLAASTDLGLDTARQFGRTLTSRVDLGSPRDGEVAEGVKFFVVGDGFSRDIGRSASTDAFDVDGVGGTLGAEFGFGNGVLGLAANYTRGRARFSGSEPARDRLRSLQLGGYAGFAIGPAFVQGHVGYGRDRHRLSREGVVEGLTARADGSHVTAGAKAGYLVPLGSLRVGPVIGADYAKAKVDGYTEEGDPALALNVDKLRLKALTGNVGLEARGDFAGGGVSLRPFVSVVAEKDFTGDGRTAFFSQTSAPTIVNRWDLGERSKDLYGRITGGASAAILPGASLDAQVSSTFRQDGGNELGAQLGLRVGF